MDAFLSVPWMPYDISPAYDDDSSQANFTSLARGATMYPNVRSDDIEGRYVDGISVTVDCPTCQQPRQHVFTLAAGTASSVPEVVATQLRQDDPEMLQTALTCPYPLLGVPLGRHCFLGNCRCHTTQQLREASMSPYPPDAFQVPDFVGNSYFCDAGAGPSDSAVGNGWNGHLMFSTNTTCPPSGEMRDASWWAAQATTPGASSGPGYFESFVASPTFEPLEVRLMTGRDSYYENLGIISMELEACICRANQPRDECVAACQGNYVSCDRDQVSTCTCDALSGQCGCTCTPAPQFEIRVGIMLPFLGTADKGFARVGWSPRVGVYQALREINNKSDGVADDLLPGRTLLFAYRDSKCDSAVALESALHLVNDAFGGRGVDVIIGAGCRQIDHHASGIGIAAKMAGAGQ